MLKRGKMLVRMAIGEQSTESSKLTQEKELISTSISQTTEPETHQLDNFDWINPSNILILNLDAHNDMVAQTNEITPMNDIDIPMSPMIDWLNFDADNDIVTQKNEITPIGDIDIPVSLNRETRNDDTESISILNAVEPSTPESHTVMLENINMDEESSVGQKRKRNPSNWKKNVSKKLRMSGDEYVGYRRTKEGKVIQDSPKEKKVMGPPCTSKTCAKSSARNCNVISEETRKLLFQNYWKIMTWDQRKVYLANMVETCQSKRSTVEWKSRRQNSLKYHFIVDGRKIQVCQKMFLQTLGIKQWTVRYWIGENSLKQKSDDQIETIDDPDQSLDDPDLPLAESKQTTSNKKIRSQRSAIKNKLKELTLSGMAPNTSMTRKSTQKIPKKPLAVEYVKKFFHSLAKLPSHYCRKTTSRLYLEPNIRSLTELYDIFKGKCKEDHKNEWKNVCVSQSLFRKMFAEMNLAIYMPKKDRCDTCCSYEVGNISDDQYMCHRMAKEGAREEKSRDKAEAEAGRIHVFTSDLQAVKLAPCINASAQYYKTKLNVHNFTMYNLKTKEVKCYWFDEITAQLEASIFASCVIDNLSKTLDQEPKPVVLWSDGCGYQNRNSTLSNALLHFSMTRNIVIEQKFLVKGHTQMECDSVHSTIERVLKKREIHLPSQYLSATIDARKTPFPYDADFLHFSFFKDYSAVQTMLYPSIRPGKRVGDPTVNDLRSIKYIPTGEIHVKIHNFNNIYSPLPVPRCKKTVNPILVFPQLYLSPQKISRRKWRDLQDLKTVIPVDCHSFYDSLMHE